MDPAVLACLVRCDLNLRHIYISVSFQLDSCQWCGSSTKGLVPPVLSFGEVFGGGCGDKLAVSCAIHLWMELIREKVLICWDTFPQSIFTNFSEGLREVYLPPGITPEVDISKED